jgi:hypothetical protein
VEFISKLVDMALGSVPEAIKLALPANWKKEAVARISELLPQRISTNHDLVRAVRLAWIEACLTTLRNAKALTAIGGEHSQESFEAFSEILVNTLRTERTRCFDREQGPGVSPIDDHVAVVMAGTADFPGTLSKLTGWRAEEIPPAVLLASGQGNNSSSGNRQFGELVFASFAEIIKSPEAYPEARVAFQVAMTQMGTELAQTTLDAVRKLDDRLSQALSNTTPELMWQRSLAEISEIIPKLESSASSILSAQLGAIDEQQKQGLLLQQIAAKLGISGGTEALDARVEHLQRQLDVTRSDLISILKEIAAGDVGLDTLDEMAKLSKQNLDRSRDKIRKLREHELLGESAKSALEEAHAALSSDGILDLSSVQNSLSQARNALRRAAAARHREDKLALGELLDAEGAMAMARAHFIEAARFFADEAAELVGVSDVGVGLALAKRGEALAALGKTTATNEPLQDAIADFQLAAQHLEHLSARDHALTIMNIGAVQSTLGMRLSGVDGEELLVRSSSASERAGLAETLKDEERALAFSNMAGALAELGSRRRGDAGVKILQEAVAASVRSAAVSHSAGLLENWALAEINRTVAVRQLVARTEDRSQFETVQDALARVLAELPQHRYPEVWAQAASQLANLLLVSSAGMDFEATKEALWKSVDLHLQAIALLSRETSPIEWAMSNDGLSIVRAKLGEMTSGEESVAMLRAGIENSRSALSVYSEANTPMLWNAASTNLANGLLVLSMKIPGEEGVNLMFQAAAAAREAAARFALVAKDVAWAQSKFACANAALKLAGRMPVAKVPDQLNLAVGELEEILEEVDRDRELGIWREAQLALSIALCDLIPLAPRGDVENLARRAVSAAEAALSTTSMDTAPSWWGHVQSNFANALKMLGQCLPGQEGIEVLRQSVAAIDILISKQTQGSIPWAVARNNASIVYRAIGEREGFPRGLSALTDARKAAEEAVDAYEQLGETVGWANAKHNLGTTLVIYAEGIERSRREPILWQAVRAFDDALSVRTQSSFPNGWSATSSARERALGALLLLQF